MSSSSPSSRSASQPKPQTGLTFSILNMVFQLGAMFPADTPCSGIMHRVYRRKVRNVLCDTTEQLDLAVHPHPRALDFNIVVEGDRSADGAGLDADGVSVRQSRGGLDALLKLAWGEGAEGAQIAVDLVVLVRKGDVVLTGRQRSMGTSRRRLTRRMPTTYRTPLAAISPDYASCTRPPHPSGSCSASPPSHPSLPSHPG